MTIYASILDPLIQYHVADGVVYTRVCRGEWMATKHTPQQLEDAIGAKVEVISQDVKQQEKAAEVEPLF